jgi:hypothetical protein
MESVGVEMDKDEVYPVMEDWMSTKLGKSHLTACVSKIPHDLCIYHTTCHLHLNMPFFSYNSSTTGGQ